MMAKSVREIFRISDAFELVLGFPGCPSLPGDRGPAAGGPARCRGTGGGPSYLVVIKIVTSFLGVELKLRKEFLALRNGS
jgi:hypothetical protein